MSRPDDARSEILARIRTALADRPDPAPAERTYRTSVPADVDRFADRLRDYKATVHHCAPEAVAATVAGILPAQGRIVIPGGWLDLPARDVATDTPQLSPADLDAAAAVVTRCAVGIAETGTIVLDAGDAQGRRALTLVPDVHVVVIDEAQVVGLVPEALTRLDPTRPLTWISGPSATSDIELQRVEGVHGPRTLHVVLVGCRATSGGRR
ncbi:LUD domain-containing protein [Dactylosporangium sp. AC04546]|uniref:LutC/YkgG family protein n=1 Tax=Dactylosporangium sp. AC04546 TaxID=2862460 RepID=UPI001EDEEAE3|nr:LUD domain-containing protein [Dactylosporangium sp. AC04546]WVK78382.1 LUD domain-containing protein [Dactylosporangium sp. AC04546]